MRTTLFHSLLVALRGPCVERVVRAVCVWPLPIRGHEEITRVPRVTRVLRQARGHGAELSLCMIRLGLGWNSGWDCARMCARGIFPPRERVLPWIPFKS